MAFDGVISFQGKDHITAPQIGRLIAGVAGSVRGILQTQNQIKAAMQTANRVRIDTGDVLFDARMRSLLSLTLLMVVLVISAMT